MKAHVLLVHITYSALSPKMTELEHGVCYQYNCPSISFMVSALLSHVTSSLLCRRTVIDLLSHLGLPAWTCARKTVFANSVPNLCYTRTVQENKMKMTNDAPAHSSFLSCLWITRLMMSLKLMSIPRSEPQLLTQVRSAGHSCFSSSMCWDVTVKVKSYVA